MAIRVVKEEFDINTSKATVAITTFTYLMKIELCTDETCTNETCTDETGTDEMPIGEDSVDNPLATRK
jgi:hypothetical protein